MLGRSQCGLYSQPLWSGQSGIQRRWLCIILGYPHPGYYKSTPLFPGDLIKVVQQSETGSWYGECGYRKGRFKFNYVTLLPHYRNWCLVIHWMSDGDIFHPTDISLTFYYKKCQVFMAILVCFKFRCRIRMSPHWRSVGHRQDLLLFFGWSLND